MSLDGRTSKKRQGYLRGNRPLGDAGLCLSGTCTGVHRTRKNTQRGKHGGDNSPNIRWAWYRNEALCITANSATNNTTSSTSTAIRLYVPRNLPPCPICATTKSKASPIREPSRPATELLELLHADISYPYGRQKPTNHAAASRQGHISSFCRTEYRAGAPSGRQDAHNGSGKTFSYRIPSALRSYVLL